MSLYKSRVTNDALKAMLNSKESLEVPSVGVSMFPLIREGDVCSVAACKASELCEGDIGLFYTEDGILVVHRLIQVTLQHQRKLYWFKGDSNLGYDQPVGEEKILGKLQYIQRGMRRTDANSIRARIWRYLLISLPVGSTWIRIWLNRRVKTQYDSRRVKHEG